MNSNTSCWSLKCLYNISKFRSFKIRVQIMTVFWLPIIMVWFEPISILTWFLKMTERRKRKRHSEDVHQWRHNRARPSGWSVKRRVGCQQERCRQRCPGTEMIIFNLLLCLPSQEMVPTGHRPLFKRLLPPGIKIVVEATCWSSNCLFT